jgi:threonine/homoserine/homoserine lactone efflux protein
MTSAFAFMAVKLIGAAYLIYLGIRAIRAKQGNPSLPKVSAVTPTKAFLQAVPAEILNPKTALFFLAFIPQFVHPERGSVFVQFAVLGLIFVALSSLYTTLIALSIRPLGRVVKQLSWLERWQGKIIGTVFITLGIKVATQHR